VVYFIVQTSDDIHPLYLSDGKPVQNFYAGILGWDFESVRKMGSDGYPKLQWQE
jgi:predicted enzyme related to lactoylglutathione lyase